jgi:hypothetical protein
MKASDVLQAARALVREPHTAFSALYAAAHGLEQEREIVAVAVADLLDWAMFEEGYYFAGRTHGTVEGQQASYDIAISMALSDEAAE